MYGSKKRNVQLSQFSPMRYAHTRTPSMTKRAVLGRARRADREMKWTGRKSGRLIKNATGCRGRGRGSVGDEGGRGVMQINDPISRAGFSKRAKIDARRSPLPPALFPSLRTVGRWLAENENLPCLPQIIVIPSLLIALRILVQLDSNINGKSVLLVIIYIH